METLQTMSWRQVEERLRETDLALVPIGAVEVYGPHMPQGTDGIVASAACEELARRVDCLVTPLIPVGYSAKILGFPGTLTVPPDAVGAYVRGITESLQRFGVRRVLFVSGHAGNVQPVDVVCQNLASPEFRLTQVDIWRFLQPLTRDLVESPAFRFGHAGEVMTSVMLHLHPEYVDMTRATAWMPETEPEPGVSSPRPYRELAPEGLLGDATLATAEKGRRIFELLVDGLESVLTHLRPVGAPAGAPGAR